MPVKLLFCTRKPPQNEESEEREVDPTEEKRARAPPLKTPVLYKKEFERIKAAAGEEALAPRRSSSMMTGPFTPPQ